MKNTFDLKQLEAQAWKSTFQDGLWDIYLGLILLNIPMGNFIAALGYETLPTVGITFTYMLGLVVLFRLSKKRITLPRLGLVNFGDGRKKKKTRLSLVLAISVAITVTLLLITISGKNADGGGGLSSVPAWIPLIIGAVVAIPMFAIAYFNTFLRGYYIAALFTLTIVSYEFFDSNIIFVVGSLIIMLPGVLLLSRFLRDYPLPVNRE